MAINKLNDLKLESTLSKIKKEYDKNQKIASSLIGDGGGLYLQVSKTATASWLFRYMRNGKAKTMGLGGYPAVPLKSARLKAQEIRELLANGQDPLSLERALEEKKRLQTSQTKTFEECAQEYIELQRPSWKNVKHAQQWTNTLTSYAFPVIGKLGIAQIHTEDIKKIVIPIWLTKNETASRLRGRIESIIDWATVQGWRTGDNPARLKGHFEHLVPKRLVTGEGKHHAALPYSEMPQFMQSLSLQEGMARWALEFTILTACRTTEVLEAQWHEFDFENNLWTIPAERMKAKRQHRVPLAHRTLDILQSIKPFSSETYVFPSVQKHKSTGQATAMSNMAMSSVLRRMEVANVTVHGMRSTFRDWCGEKTNHEFQVAEAALAHQLESKVAAAYARGDLYDKRFALMRDWAEYCGSGDCGSSVKPKKTTKTEKPLKH